MLLYVSYVFMKRLNYWMLRVLPALTYNEGQVNSGWYSHSWLRHYASLCWLSLSHLLSTEVPRLNLLPASSPSAYHDGGEALCQGISCRPCADEANASSQCPFGHLHPQAPSYLGTQK